MLPHGVGFLAVFDYIIRYTVILENLSCSVDIVVSRQNEVGVKQSFRTFDHRTIIIFDHPTSSKQPDQLKVQDYCTCFAIFLRELLKILLSHYNYVHYLTLSPQFNYKKRNQSELPLFLFII